MNEELSCQCYLSFLSFCFFLDETWSWSLCSMQLSTRLPPFIPVLCLVLSVFLTAPAWTVAAGAHLSVALLAVAVGAGEHQQQCLHLPRCYLLALWWAGGCQGWGVTLVLRLGRFVFSTSACSDLALCCGELWQDGVHQRCPAAVTAFVFSACAVPCSRSSPRAEMSSAGLSPELCPG